MTETESEEIAHAVLYIFLLICIGCFVGGSLFGYYIYPHPILVPTKPEDAETFYTAILHENNVTVTRKDQSTSDYKKAGSFGEFLWMLKTANLTECYFSPWQMYWATPSIAKFWFMYDGVVWEFRLE